MSTPAPRDLRRQKEADFHDQWAADVSVTEALVDETFTSVYSLVEEPSTSSNNSETCAGSTVLDYGCGAAEGGIYLAKRGAKVVAMDVSPGDGRAFLQTAPARRTTASRSKHAK